MYFNILKYAIGHAQNYLSGCHGSLKMAPIMSQLNAGAKRISICGGWVNQIC
jgi:hypothetical protein